jgi:hypothetical protein
MYKGQRILQIVRGMDRKMQLLGFWEFLKFFVRKPGNRGILQISGILSISNSSVFSAYDGFDSRLHQYHSISVLQPGYAPAM